MEDFKRIVKMKTGGSVSKAVAAYEKRENKTEESADIAQDKKIVKKAISMHDAQEHKGEKTDLSKLKKGGRAKCSTGTVNRYKAGGSVTNVYEAKKSSGDLNNISKVKSITPAKAAAPSKAAISPIDNLSKQAAKPSGHKDPYIKSKQSGKAAAAPTGAKGPDAYKKGGKVKMAPGGSVMAALEKQRQMEKMKRALGLGPAQQGQLISQDPSAAGLTPPPAPTPAPAMQAPGGVSPAGAIPMQKRGGKVKKGC